MTHPVHAAQRTRTGRRGPLRRVLEVRGVVGGYRRPRPVVRLVAADGTRLVGSYLQGPAAATPAVLLAHGFAAHRRKPAYARLAEGLATHVHVLAVDLRGHGQSGGRCALGDREALDVAAGLDWLRGFGHGHLTAVGVSMGGTSVLHAAVLARPGPSAVVAVSTPARVHGHDSAPMRRLREAWHTPWKRAAMALLLNVSTVPPRRWRPPPDPVAAAGQLDVPLLVVHGADDGYFPPSDAEEVAAAAGGQATLWARPAGFGHAEDGMTAAFGDRLGRAIVAAAATGRFPAWGAVPVSRPGAGG